MPRAPSETSRLLALPLHKAYTQDLKPLATMRRFVPGDDIAIAVHSLTRRAATCTLDSITWSCSATPHLTLKFSKVTVTECDEINTKDAFKTLLSISYTGKNIDQGKDLVDGTMLTGQDIMEYAPPTPPKETGIHRYFVFLFEETNPVTATKDLVRRKFHLATFAEENKLCGPVASNMFRTQY
ncbi:Protein D2 [Portunus trituberculatus]|uniref:Protein D2 n=1 Tax=Portunus trituberculatus TaxID=210409 RepID=A0A5B7ED55_PORTR|nr:Protein D2 [Portunus trituberculatus]